jgi:HEAT repeat protein
LTESPAVRRAFRFPRTLLVAGPVVVFCAFAAASLVAIGVLSVLAAMGHGQLTASEALPYVLLGGAVTMAACTGTALLLERGLLGPAGLRSPEMRTLAWQTRVASAALIVIITVSAPGAWSGWVKWRELTNARARGGSDRYSAIYALGARGTPQARDTLITIARDTSEPEDARAAAVGALGLLQDTRDVLLSLSSDPAPGVRAAVGVSLLPRADEAAAWAAVEQLARDESLAVRERMAAALAEARIPAAAEERRRALLREIARGDTPAAALSAAAALGHEGYDAALAIVMDVSQLDGRRQDAIQVLGKLKDPRALAVLRQIVNSETAEGFIAFDREEGYREAAAHALASITSPDGDELALAYFNERLMRHELQRVTEAQARYAAATGFFDARLACLELPATCVPGRDVDESFLGPALASGVPRHGYERRLIGGPPPAAAAVAARGSSPTSVTTFAYVAVPQVPFESGVRGFCADDTGLVCISLDGRAPDVRGGRCVCQTR